MTGDNSEALAWPSPDARDVVSEYAKNGSNWDHARSYVQGLWIDSKVARIENSGTTYYYLGDVLATTHYLLNSSGGIVNTTVSKAFGETLVDSQSTSDRFSFTQREKDSESGLHHFRARPYDPRLGRFVGKDPVNPALDHYVYATNSPIRRIDPLGLQDEPDRNGRTKSDAASSQADLFEHLESELNRLQSSLGRDASWSEFLNQLLNYFTDNNPGRYVYTCGYGWIDMRHLLMIYDYTDSIWFTSGMALAAAERVERDQALAGESSGFSVEDLPSNQLGVQFESWLEDEYAKRIGHPKGGSFLGRGGACGRHCAVGSPLRRAREATAHDEGYPKLRAVDGRPNEISLPYPTSLA